MERGREMGSSSKDLLQLEHKNSSTTSPLESTLLVCKEDSQSRNKEHLPHGKRTITPVSQSQVLGKVKDFLGVISEANKQLQQDAKDNSHNYDIEVLTGNESQVIKMDLMLGIADLHTPEVVAAAESAMAGRQPLIPLASGSSESESEDTSDDEDSDDEDNKDDSDDGASDDGDKKTCSSPNYKTSKFGKDGSRKVVGNSKSKKRPKIVEMS